MSVTFYAGRLDGILRPVGDLDAAPNLSNGNARWVLETLRIDTGDDCTGSMEIGPALGIMHGWLRTHINLPSGARETHVECGDGPTIIHCGVEAGYLNRRIHALAVMLAAGREAGATHLCWG